jgi:hypothetical protein
MRITTVLLLLALAGCARTIWVQPGKTAEDYQRDRYECEKTSAASQNPDRAAGIKQCLEAKGWMLQRRQRA